MLQYDWPGNVRQLENFAERVILAADHRRLTAKNFSSLMQLKRSKDTTKPRTVERRSPLRIDADRTLEENVRPLVEQVERNYLVAVLRSCGGKIAESAKCAGISRRTLLRKLTTYGIDKTDFK
jgi:DNA-binding NtrC family response regulator